MELALAGHNTLDTWKYALCDKGDQQSHQMQQHGCLDIVGQVAIGPQKASEI